jgi:adenine phosphoribosyltransferase
MTLYQYIRDVQYFPKLRAVSEDTIPLFGSPDAVKQCMALLINNLKDKYR